MLKSLDIKPFSNLSLEKFEGLILNLEKTSLPLRNWFNESMTLVITAHSCDIEAFSRVNLFNESAISLLCRHMPV